jgi:hypothetical protein
MATKAKMEALAKLMEVVEKYGQIETMLKENELESFDYRQEYKEDVEKSDAKRTAMSNEFVSQLLGQLHQGSGQQQEQMHV